MCDESVPVAYDNRKKLTALCREWKPVKLAKKRSNLIGLRGNVDVGTSKSNSSTDSKLDDSSKTSSCKGDARCNASTGNETVRRVWPFGFLVSDYESSD